MQSLARGQKLKLADLTPSQQLQIGVSAQAPGLTFDISCFGIDADGKLSDDRYFVFFNQKSSPEGALKLLGAQSGDDATFALDLARLPGTIKRLVFVVTLDGAGTMAQLARGAVRLSAGGNEAARFEFKGADFGAEKAVMAAEIYFKDVWRVAAVGQGFAGGLSAVLKHFGGQELDAAPAPTAMPTPPTAARPVPPAPPPLQPRVQPPPAAPPATKVNLGKVTLEKKGEKSAVNLKKGGGLQPIRINLNWDNPNAGKRGLFGSAPKAPDLDLGCMFRLKNGEKSVIQPLGNRFGSKDGPPYIFLDKDDRSGAAADGENLIIFRPDLIDTVMVFAMIYEGASDFSDVGGRLSIRDSDDNEIFIRLSSPDRNSSFCAVATIQGTGSQIEVTKQELYFRDQREADLHFGFGFRWGVGAGKD